MNAIEKAAYWQEKSTVLLNNAYASLSPLERMEQLFVDFPADKILMTSSFGTSSALLLSLVSEVRPDLPIYFLDTTYHFPETLAYKEMLTEQLNLNVVDVLPDASQNQITRDEKMWESDPQLCCMVNKVLPLDSLKPGHLVWISGVMAYQTAFREAMQLFEVKDDLVKFHPLLDISEAEANQWFAERKLPQHPLTALGYGSVGCTNCTVKGAGREGRWSGKNKTECGLHVEGEVVKV